MNGRFSLKAMLLCFLAISHSACSQSQSSDVELDRKNSAFCDQLLGEFGGKVLSRKNAVAAITQLTRECQPSNGLDLDMAEIYIGAGEYEKASSLLERSASNDKELEPRRLFYLYGFRRRALDRIGATALEENANSSFPDSPYSRLMHGVELCQHIHCKDAIEDLKIADDRLHNRMALGYLMAAYADSGNFDAAMDCLDKFRAVAPIDAFDDLLVYVGVFTYAQAGRYEDAHKLYDDYVDIFPESKSSNYIRRTRELLLSLKSSAT